MVSALFHSLSFRERIFFIVALILVFGSLLFLGFYTFYTTSDFSAASGGVYREGVVGQPTLINPLVSSRSPDQDVSMLLYGRMGDFLQSYEVSEDGRVYSLKLKEGLVWDDGWPLTSDDVAFTFRTIQDPSAQSPFFSLFHGVVFERMSELQLSLVLPSPFAFFSDRLLALPLIPRHIFERTPPLNFNLSSYALAPVGSGPYRFVSLSHSSRGFISEYRLERNERYAGDAPFIRNFVFRFYEREEDLLRAYRFKEIDGFGTFDPVSVSSLDSQVRIEHVPTTHSYFLFFNATHNPALKNRDLRRALSFSLDREAMLREVFTEDFSSYGRSVSFSSEYDILRARDLFARSPQTQTSLEVAAPDTPLARKLALAIQEHWETLGVLNVSFVFFPLEKLLQDVIPDRDYDILLFGVAPLDSQDVFPFWHSSLRYHPGLNFALYQDPDVDSLLLAIRRTLRETERESLLKNVWDSISSDAPAAFLFSLPYTHVHSPDFRGVDLASSTDPMVFASDRFSKVSSWYSARVRGMR